MAVTLECISIIIPIAKLKALHDARVEELLNQEFGDENDGDLVRISAMNQMDVMLIINSLKEKGLRLTRRKNGVEQWMDLCVVDRFTGPTLPCEWLDWDQEKSIAWIKPKNV